MSATIQQKPTSSVILRGNLQTGKAGIIQRMLTEYPGASEKDTQIIFNLHDMSIPGNHEFGNGLCYKRLTKACKKYGKMQCNARTVYYVNSVVTQVKSYIHLLIKLTPEQEELLETILWKLVLSEAGVYHKVFRQKGVDFASSHEGYLLGMLFMVKEITLSEKVGEDLANQWKSISKGFIFNPNKSRSFKKISKFSPS